MAVAVQSMPVLNGHAEPNGHSSMDGTPNGTPAPIGAPKFATGLILPPPEIKSVIDRTATFVAKYANPEQFEDKIRANQRNDPKFSFLNPADPYHAYYRHRLDKIARGELEDEAMGDATAGAVPGQQPSESKPVVDLGLEPPSPVFILNLPNISAIDLDTMKLTALFTARRGRAFLNALAAKESRNFQFEFLQPNHSLFGYFNRLVDQYTRVILPGKELLATVKEQAEEGARWRTLDIARRHARWEASKREKDKAREEEKEAERVAFAEIDWHDYAIVQTIEFTAADAQAELPPPMSVQEVENMTLAQKRMAAMIMENTVEDVEALRAKQAAEDEALAAAHAAEAAGEDAVMQESDDEDPEAQARKKREEEEREKEIERAKAIQASSLGAGGPMKIRADYVPKLGAKGKNAATTTCSICGQQIPVDELSEHMRIELLDPRWKSQRDALEARKAQSSELQRGANVVSSLKNLARTRVDIFGAGADEERRKREQEEENERRKEREKVVWDGHTATKLSTQDRFSSNVNFDEQIAAIHRAKGLGPQEENAIGPGIGPAAAPPPELVRSGLPPAPASLPPPPTGGAAGNHPAYAAATVSSGPQPASMYPNNQPVPVMLPPLHFQGLPPNPGFGGYVPPPQAVPGQAQTPMQTPQATGGVVRSAEEMEGAEGGEGVPPAKRQKVAKLPAGQFYPEQDWINMHPHPISLQLQLPTDESKPEWKLDGSTITLPDLPLNFLVSTLRDRFLQQTGSTVPASRLRLSHQGQMLTNANTIASYNLEEDDVLVLSVRDQRKR